MYDINSKYLKFNNITSLTLYTLCALLTILIFLADLAFPLGVAINVLYIIVVLISLLSPNKAFTFVIALVSSVLTILGFFFSPPGETLWKILFNRTIALFTIWITTIISLQRKSIEAKRGKAVEERERILEETRVLRGLIPICASCKKIRTDEGYWTQIESYIRKHSEAEFSHGICPECAEKLYPEFTEKNLVS